MSNMYNNIVVPIAPHYESTWCTALPLAIDLALQHQATLHLVTVVLNADIPAIAVHLPKDIDQQALNKGRDVLESLAKDLIPETSANSAYVTRHAQLFDVSIGIGVLFWSIAEPIYHFQGNPLISESQKLTSDVTQIAVRIVIFHWGLYGWALFGLTGLILNGAKPS